MYQATSIFIYNAKYDIVFVQKYFPSCMEKSPNFSQLLCNLIPQKGEELEDEVAGSNKPPLLPPCSNFCDIV